ncbi:hypothetical protein JCM10449v2_002922 [Rhodotorula kratochvilovae]
MPPLAQLVLSVASSPLWHTAGPPPTRAARADLDDSVARQPRISTDKVFGNIGAAAGAALVFTWTRDSALTALGLLSLLPTDTSAAPTNSSLALGPAFENRTHDFFGEYITANLALQHVSNPSGTFETLEGLGEPKFHPNLTAFEDEWGRPQRDGPALRALAVMRARFWNHTTYDLWEEVLGSSYFTAVAQYHALSLGAMYFASSPSSHSAVYSAEAHKALCFAQEFGETVDGGGARVRSNINVENDVKRSGLDANSILATLLAPPSPSLTCPCASFLPTPCSPASLSTLYHLLSSFTSLYPLNPPQAPSAPLAPLAIGRYPEDTYYGGNPWFLTTLAAAEALYRALGAWEQEGAVSVGDVDGQFWDALAGRKVRRGRWTRGAADGEFERPLGRVWELADGLLDVVHHYIPAGGSMAEQLDKVTGAPTSARDLTWSYVAYLTATNARSAALTASSALRASSPSFDSSAALPNPLLEAALHCPPASAYNGRMLVRFEIEARTEWGETIFLTGSAPSLGKWDLSRAVRLSAAGYTVTRPFWRTEDAVQLEGRRGWEYKFVKLKQDGAVVWEGGENRIVYTSSGGERAIRVKWRE